MGVFKDNAFGRVFCQFVTCNIAREIFARVCIQPCGKQAKKPTKNTRVAANLKIETACILECAV